VLAHDNPFPSLLVVEGSAPSSPASGAQRVYIDSTSHHLSRKTSGGSVVDLETNQASSGVASGSSFPGSPSTSDLYFRTDRGRLYYYDGTRWLTVEEFSSAITVTDALTPVTSTGTGDQVGVADQGDIGLWCTRVKSVTLVTGTNNGSNYWQIQPRSRTTSGTTGNLGTVQDTSADTGSNSTMHTFTVGAVVSSSAVALEFLFTRVGSGGGGIYLLGGTFWYRLIG
jgi:hypothetical protein